MHNLIIKSRFDCFHFVHRCQCAMLLISLALQLAYFRTPCIAVTGCIVQSTTPLQSVRSISIDKYNGKTDKTTWWLHTQFTRFTWRLWEQWEYAHHLPSAFMANSKDQSWEIEFLYSQQKEMEPFWWAILSPYLRLNIPWSTNVDCYSSTCQFVL